MDKGSSNVFQQSSNQRASEQLALGEAELAFAADLLAWLCQRRIIGSITMRNAMLEVAKYNAVEGAGRRGPAA